MKTIERGLTVNKVINLLRYDCISGKVFWKERDVNAFASERAYKIWASRYANKEAGCVGGDGYRRLTYKGKNHLCHRLIFAILNGRFPNGEIDHINHTRDDNRAINLREATAKQNQMNRTINKNSTSGISGVTFFKKTKSWRVRLFVDGKSRYFGYHKDKELAELVACEAMIKSGFHLNHGKSHA